MSRLGDLLRRAPGIVAGVAGVVLLAVIAVVVTSGGSSSMHLTAHFPRAVGLYTNSSVRILGVPVGKVTSIKPEGTSVKVEMTYSAKHRLPSNVQAYIVPPSLVSDRYVELSPIYKSGQLLPDDASLPVARSHDPVELDDILRSVNDLDVALGPNGANKDGALSRLLGVADANLRGNGAKLHQTIHDSASLLDTLADNKDQLVKVVNNLSTFTHTLSSSDSKVRELTSDLASVTGELSAERGDLAAAMRNLATALGDVAQLVKDNRTTITSDVQGLTSVTQTILKQRDSLIETLDDAPLAIQNLYNAYDPESESLRTKGDFEQITDPTILVCSLLATFTGDDTACSKIPDCSKLALSGLLGGGK